MGTEWGWGVELVCVCPEVLWGGWGLLELLGRRGHLDVLAFLQPLLALDQVVDAIDHRLHQLDLRQKHTSLTSCV